jgi:hypothetical protein
MPPHIIRDFFTPLREHQSAAIYLLCLSRVWYLAFCVGAQGRQRDAPKLNKNQTVRAKYKNIAAQAIRMALFAPWSMNKQKFASTCVPSRPLSHFKSANLHFPGAHQAATQRERASDHFFSYMRETRC